jgi:hypothetical protein
MNVHGFAVVDTNDDEEVVVVLVLVVSLELPHPPVF